MFGRKVKFFIVSLKNPELEMKSTIKLEKQCPYNNNFSLINPMSENMV